MTLDERAFDRVIEESQDLQSDAIRKARTTVPELEEIRDERPDEPVDPDDVHAYEHGRRELVRDLGLAPGIRRGLLAGGFGALLAGILAAPASAEDGDVDVQILQTASSLEVLAVATYGAALDLPFIKDGNSVVVKFAQTTRMQHDEHRKAFQAQTKALGGKKQTKPNPKYAPVVEQMKPSLQGPMDVVNLAATLEQVATETYLKDLGLFTNKGAKSKQVMASVMGVETQHLATLRAVRALLAGGAADLITLPPDITQLPAAAGSVAFPTAFQGTEMASPPEEGAR
jgi:hypothetical protein